MNGSKVVERRAAGCVSSVSTIVSAVRVVVQDRYRLASHLVVL